MDDRHARSIAGRVNRPTLVAWAVLIPLSAVVVFAAVALGNPLAACATLPLLAFFVLSIGVCVSWHRGVSLRVRSRSMCRACLAPLTDVGGAPAPLCPACGTMNLACFGCGYDLTHVPTIDRPQGSMVAVQPSTPGPRRCPECGLLNTTEAIGAIIRSTTD